MSVKFKHNNKVFDSEACFKGLNLLGHAQMIELDLGSTCGGHGKCGKDRLILDPVDQAKVNPITFIERQHLTETEINSGMRLACQCFPDEDGLSVEVNQMDT